MSLVSHPTPITLLQLFLLATVAKGLVASVYLHWTAGRYGQCFDDYHLNIDRDGELYLCCKSLAEHKSHTWQRNSAAIGISLCAGFEALAGNEPQDGSPPSIDFGPYEPTAMQLEKMALVVAVISKAAMEAIVNSQAFADILAPIKGVLCTSEKELMYEA